MKEEDFTSAGVLVEVIARAHSIITDLGHFGSEGNFIHLAATRDDEMSPVCNPRMRVVVNCPTETDTLSTARGLGGRKNRW